MRVFGVFPSLVRKKENMRQGNYQHIGFVKLYFLFFFLEKIKCNIRVDLKKEKFQHQEHDYLFNKPGIIFR